MAYVVDSKVQGLVSEIELEPLLVSLSRENKSTSKKQRRPPMNMFGLPFSWIAKAAETSSGAAYVGILLWWHGIYQKWYYGEQRVMPTLSRLSMLAGLSKQTLSRRIMELEKAKLLTVERKRGVRLIVTFVLLDERV